MAQLLPSDVPALPLTGGNIDRGGQDRRRQEWLEAALAAPATRVLAVREGALPLVDAPGGAASIAELHPVDVRAWGEPTQWVWLGRLDGIDWLCAGFPDAPELNGATWADLRQAGPRLGIDQAALFTQALGVLNWHAANGFCPRCGSATEVVDAGWVRRCLTQGTELFPRTDPAIITLVTDADDRVLLGANAAWGGSRYSLFAGFVEPGESLEEAVRREVSEEAGVRLADVSYLSSQPWPLPASLMVGFHAVAAGTESVADGEEILDTRWFTRGELGEQIESGAIGVPSTFSIAGMILEAWYGQPLPEASGVGGGAR